MGCPPIHQPKVELVGEFVKVTYAGEEYISKDPMNNYHWYAIEGGLLIGSDQGYRITRVVSRIGYPSSQGKAYVKEYLENVEQD